MGAGMNQVPGGPSRLSKALLDQVDRHFGVGDESMRRIESRITSSTVVPSVQQKGQTLFEDAPEH